jgi:hypothetical protein
MFHRGPMNIGLHVLDSVSTLIFFFDYEKNPLVFFPLGMMHVMVMPNSEITQYINQHISGETPWKAPRITIHRHQRFVLEPISKEIKQVMHEFNLGERIVFYLVAYFMLLFIQEN